MSDKLDTMLKELGKTNPGLVTFAKEEMGKLDVIPFTIPSLDAITGVGGIVRGRITEIFGMDGTFKTTLCLYAIAEAQRRGEICAFIDAEFAFSAEYAEKLGVDTSKLILIHPSSAEEAFNVMEKLIDTKEIAIIVLDSLAALSPTTELSNEFGSSNMGVAARLYGQVFRKLVAKLGNSNTAFILTNQLREQLGGYVPMKTTPGGNASRFYATLRLEIKKAAIKDGKEQTGVTLTVKTVKNKLSTPFLETELEAMFGEGIDIEKDLIKTAVERGIIQKAGAGWMTYGEVKLQGLDKFKAFFSDNPEAFEDLKKLL